MEKALSYVLVGCIVGTLILLFVPATQSHCHRGSMYFGLDPNVSQGRQLLVFLLPIATRAWLGWNRREKN